MIKKYSCLLLVLLLIVVFTGCSNPSSDSADTQEKSETGQTEKSDSVKTAVVYFSAGGTTKKAARLIAEETGADLIEIKPKKAYTSEDLDYNDDNCRANKEMKDDTARPAISSDLSAVSEYDVIYLGHPIWWGTAPRIIQTFLEEHDISQATVYTFCTSGGSDIEQSVKDLQRLYSNVNIVSGKCLNGATKTDVKEWINSLN